MSTPKPRIRQLAIFLLKKSVTSDTEAIRKRGAKAYQLNPTVGFKGTLFVKPSELKEPDWVFFLQDGVKGSIITRKNSSTSAVLILNIARRRFAICFGYGRYLLDPESYERNFGLKVVLNCVDSKSLKSVDLKTLEDLTVHTRRQASHATQFGTFGVNVSSDILCALTGKPANAAIGESVTGSDALVIHCRVEVDGLGAKCEELLDVFNSDVYKTDYDFIDNLFAVRDPSKQSKLDDKLVTRLRAGNVSTMHMAPPEILDLQRAEGFLYPFEQSTDEPHDLDVDDFLRGVENRQSITLQWLKNKKIRIKNADDHEARPQWSIYRTIVFDLTEGSKRYILSGGDWYQVSRPYSERIRQELGAIPALNLNLPDSKTNEHEADYNARQVSFTPMDGFRTRCENTRSDIEVCDLFAPDKRFLHVKRKTRSATLSHLFMQGVNSGEAFLEDTQFRTRAVNELIRRSPSLTGVVRDVRPTQSEYEISYCIITKRHKNWPHSLPFFSQISLTNSARHLRNRGYRVSLGGIHEA